jgi:ABC-2 type transport system ATP-binding protein
VYGLSAERVVALLSTHSVPFSEVAPHQASLEEAYMGLTRAAVEYRASVPASTGPEVAK